MRSGDDEYPLDGNGFLERPERWNRDATEAIARDEGTYEVSDGHWAVVNFIRAYRKEHDLAPPGCV